MSAANITPVPTGLVSTIACPGLSPPLDLISFCLTAPLMAKPSASSAPSHVWPPTRAQLASVSAEVAPAIICTRSSSTFSSSPKGTWAMARAVMGSAPIPQQSPNACTAATFPNTNGSDTNERK
eukprot:3451082-Pyramimonas_sp.AAC.1